MTVSLTALLHGQTTGYGFYYDDYHFVRPYTANEVVASFHGPWDASGIESAYYRPLTIALYAARFTVLGVDAQAYHVMSLLMFALAGTLFSVFVARLCDSRAAGAIAAAVFVAHPGMPYSAVAWITNQMHLAAMIVVFGALLWWFAVRRRGTAWWLPLLVFQAAAFLIKEDGIMLIPAIVLLHQLRKSIAERDLPNVPWRFFVAATALLASLLFLRASALHGVPAPRVPSFDQAWTNWMRGLYTFRLIPAKRPWQPQASWFVTLVPLAAALCWRRLRPSLRCALASGVLLGVLFDLPFALIVKAEQLHFVSTSAALLLTAAIAGLLEVARPWRLLQAAWLIVAIAGLAAMAVVSRNITRDFEPYGPIALHTDRIVEEWAAVPVELRAYLASKRVSDAATRPDPDPSRALPMIAFGFHGRELSPDGVPLRWMSSAVSDIFVRRGTRLVSFPVRHEAGAFREPARLTIEVDGRVMNHLTLPDGRWRQMDVPIRQHAWTDVSGMHRLRLRLDHAWVPAHIISGSGDHRTLGLQVGEIQLR